MFRFFRRKEVQMYAPITGKVIEISEVADPVFSEKMVGDGVAIEAKDGMVVAPCAGKVLQIFPTNHALGIETKEGLEILIHLGIDTVELEGRGFERIVDVGDDVEAGVPLIKMDIEKIKAEEKSPICPIIITNMERVGSIDIKLGDVEKGKDIIMIVKTK